MGLNWGKVATAAATFVVALSMNAGAASAGAEGETAMAGLGEVMRRHHLDSTPSQVAVTLDVAGIYEGSPAAAYRLWCFAYAIDAEPSGGYGGDATCHAGQGYPSVHAGMPEEIPAYLVLHEGADITVMGSIGDSALRCAGPAAPVIRGLGDPFTLATCTLN